jgi:signal transduction histidine kinase
MKRVVVPAALAVLVLLGCAAGVWVALVRGVAASMVAQSRLAGESLDADVPFTPALARALLAPGLRVVIVDRATRTVIDAGGSGVIVRTPPADGGAPPPPPGAPPPGGGFPPPEGGPPGAAPPQPAPFSAFAQTFVRLAPMRVERDDRSIGISPDLEVLVHWFLIDVAGFVLGSLVIAGLTTARVLALAQRDREALEARVTERAAAVERYQRFLAETGHELRTPLTVMMGYVDILRAGNAAGAIDQRILDGMHAETTRMRGLVEKMMTLARLDSQAAVPRLLDAGTAAREAALTVQGRYLQRDIRALTTQTASIIIDADDLSAAVGNLLENAVRYAPDSPIAIETRVRDGRVTIAVTDRGPGIGEAEREAIFDRFYRGGGRALGEGLGLGLAIVRRVAERWNGTIDCTSGEGRTEFRLSFPVADEEHDGSA